MRYELAGASIGTWYRGWRFVQEATALASMVLQQFDAFDFNSPLPGLGIPSDFAILNPRRSSQPWPGGAGPT